MKQRKRVRETVDVTVRAKIEYDRGENAAKTRANRKAAVDHLLDDVDLSVEDIRHGVSLDEDTDYWFFVVRVMRGVRGKKRRAR